MTFEGQLCATVRKGQRQSSARGSVITKWGSALLWGFREHFTEGDNRALSWKTVGAGLAPKWRKHGAVQRLVVLAGRFEVGLGEAAGRDSGNRANGLRQRRISFSRLRNLDHYLWSKETFSKILNWKATCLPWILFACLSIYALHRLCSVCTFGGWPPWMTSVRVFAS